MIIEYKNSISTVRIHDEYCEDQPQIRMQRLNQIVSESYKRRTLSVSGKSISSDQSPSS